MNAEPMIDPYALLRYSTSTVGLITSVGPRGVNVMAAEWTHLVARVPPHFAVSLQTSNYSTKLIVDRGEFGVTLADSRLASLANFAGSFSGAEVDKSLPSGTRLRAPVTTGTPTIDGGTLSAECRVVHVVDLPGYSLVIGEAVWLTVDPAANADPLVKHGAMHRIGEPIRSMTITASVTRTDDGSMRVCASAQGVRDDVPWTVGAGDVVLHTELAGEDLDVTLPPPPTAETIVVSRPDCRPARARWRPA
jgi:flavin reductase (DIM6/NTAB) family NADH-FMN oxidoreductase RutF